MADLAEVRRSIGAQLRELRLDADITQCELSERGAGAQSVISDLERGRILNPSIGRILRVADALGYEVHVRLVRPDVTSA